MDITRMFSESSLVYKLPAKLENCNQSCLRKLIFLTQVCFIEKHALFSIGGILTKTKISAEISKSVICVFTFQFVRNCVRFRISNLDTNCEKRSFYGWVIADDVTERINHDVGNYITSKPGPPCNYNIRYVAPKMIYSTTKMACGVTLKH